MAYQDTRSQTKKLIFHVYNYLKTLAGDKDKPEISNFFRKTREMTAEACGVSLACVKRVCAEGKKLSVGENRLATEPSSFKSPRKTYKRAKPMTNLDDFDNEVVRRTVHSFYDNGYGNNISMIQPSNTMSENDGLIPCCSTSNPIPSSNITDSNPNHSKTTQISNCNTSSLNDGCSNPGPSNEDEELTLPRASVNKMIKDALPNIRVANDVREMIMNCCTEFIHLVSSEANQVCMAQQKKTINAEHLLTALDHLGFGDYRAQAEEVGKDCQSKRRRQSTRLENLGIPEEELLRQQQELFAKAREEQMAQEQQQWQELQAAAQRAAIKPKTEESSDEDDYS